MRSVETINSGFVGVGFKAEHAADILAFSGCVNAFEVHAENYMSAGGARLAQLEHIRRDFALYVHGVGLSIGGSQALDREHLTRVKRVVDRFQPAIFSEHLAWSSHSGRYFGDLFPLPYTLEALDRVTANIHQIQDALQRRILLENPATYVEFKGSIFTEIEFLVQIVERTGCGLLLDVSNVFVSASNHGFGPDEYIDAFPISSVDEVHVAGHAELNTLVSDPLLIDAHNSKIAERVWELYERVLARRGPVQTVIEWDNDVPPWAAFLSEAARAESLLMKAHNSSVMPS